MKLAVVGLLLVLLSGCGLRPGPPQSTPSIPPPVQTPVAKPSLATPVVPSPTPTPEPEPETAKPISRAITAPTRARPKASPTPQASEEPTVSLRPSESNLPAELPAEAKLIAISDPELSDLHYQVKGYETAAGWRKVAERALVVEDFNLAHQAFAKEAAIYKEKGQTQAYLAERAKAAQYSTEMEIYRSVPAESPQKLERMEPANGCYVGAFIDRDSTLEKHHFASQIHGDIPQFNELVRRDHASFFMYRGYGHPFPTQWANFVKEHGGIPHIAWEPKDLSEVTDDAYLARFLAAAKEYDHPVILRFASEMNGEWTGYHGDPEEYKRVFRFMHQKTREAPKVALMWCVNTVPQATIEDYYPGDDYVDWVGVNFYSVPFLDNDKSRPGDRIHPADHLDYVYQTFSQRKPIAIGEWAASQESILTERNLEDFATAKLSQLYATLPTRYPRVKMVNWYDCNNIVQARAGRKLNNFQITNSNQLLDSYIRAVSSPHYLSANQSSSLVGYQLAKDSVILKTSDELKVYLKSYDPVLRVYFHAGGDVIHASDDPLEWFVTGAQLAKLGKGELKILVYDSKNRFVTRSSLKFEVK